MWDDLKEGELARFHDTGKLYADENDDWGPGTRREFVHGAQRTQ